MELKCAYKNCINVAGYENEYETEEIFCRIRSKKRKTIKYDSCCRIYCNKISKYKDINRQIILCEIHNKNPELNYYDLREEISLKNTIAWCYDCGKKCNVIYTCSCNTKRCLNCAYLYMWYLYTFDELICGYCFRKLNYNNTIDAMERIYVYCEKCQEKPKYKHSNRYYCDLHKPDSSIKGKYCLMKYCRVIIFDENIKFCKYHSFIFRSSLYYLKNFKPYIYDLAKSQLESIVFKF